MAIDMRRFGAVLLLLLGGCLAPGEIRVRPNMWAQPLIGTTLNNCYKVDEKLYRAEQPSANEMKILEEFGIRCVISLRKWDYDKDRAKGTELVLKQVGMDAGSITELQLREALRMIDESEGPILVHCRLGSDRTGAVCAAYRIAVQEWSVEDAIDEIIHGGYGFHRGIFENIPKTLRSIDWDEFRKKLSNN